MRLADVQNFRGRALHVRPDADETVICAWFAGCERDATTTVPHPILGDVPACESCATRAAIGHGASG